MFSYCILRIWTNIFILRKALRTFSNCRFGFQDERRFQSAPWNSQVWAAPDRKEPISSSGLNLDTPFTLHLHQLPLSLWALWLPEQRCPEGQILTEQLSSGLGATDACKLATYVETCFLPQLPSTQMPVWNSISGTRSPSYSEAGLFCPCIAHKTQGSTDDNTLCSLTTHKPAESRQLTSYELSCCSSVPVIRWENLIVVENSSFAHTIDKCITFEIVVCKSSFQCGYSPEFQLIL